MRRAVAAAAAVFLAVTPASASTAGHPAFILCDLDQPHLVRQLRAAPRACNTLGPRDSNYQAANLANLAWHGWGAGQATATGVELGQHLPFSHIKVTVRVYRLRRADCGRRVYTRLTAGTRFGTLTVRYPAVCGDASDSVVAFRSPTGAIDCGIVAHSAFAPWAACASAYTLHRHPAREVCGSGVSQVSLDRHGPARLVESCQPYGPPPIWPLRYGRSILLRGFRCTSARTGMTCVSLASGHGFKLSRERLSRF